MNKKEVTHSLVVGGILCAVGAAAALLVGLTNLVTEPVIAENERVALESALSECFKNEDLKFTKEGEEDIVLNSVEGHEYLTGYYICYDAQDAVYGYAFRGDGSNTYGSIDLLVGLRQDDAGELVYGYIGLISDTQSFKTKLEGNYVADYNDDPGEDSLNDTTCGATYGAKLIKNIVNDAISYYQGSELWK